MKDALDFLCNTRLKYTFEKISEKTYPLEDIEKAFGEQDKGLVSRSAIVMS